MSVDRALLDTFLVQNQYGFGCYTASKIVYAHAVLDYYARVKKDPRKADLVRRVLHDEKSLVGLEPAGMWNFEHDFDEATRDIPGKILNIKRDVAKYNFVPGQRVCL